MLNNYYRTISCCKVLFLFAILLLTSATELSAQCSEPNIDLPDEDDPVENPPNPYCVSIPINPAVTGNPIGFSFDLEHTWIGDLSIRANACGETLILMTRPGGGTCNGMGCDCGDPSDVNGFFTFSEGGGPDPDNGIAFGGGNYGLSGDPCGINTVNSFAELAAACGGGPYTIDFCIADHALGNVGFAGSVAPIFPGVPPTICGCTDPAATNYDPSASFDDGSCIYPPGCGETFFDSGGPSGDYQNNEAITTTICPDSPGGVVEVTFSSFNTENNFDFLTIYDGPDASAPQIGVYSGNNSPGTVTSSHPSGCLTFFFDSDGSIARSGWEATVNCVGGCVPPPPPSVGPVQICQGESATLSASPCSGGTLRWYTSPTGGSPIANGSVFSTPVLNSTTTYYVECDLGSCASDRAPVNVEVLPDPVPMITGPDAICVGESGTLTVGGSFDSYLWNTGAASSSIAVSAPGTYFVTVTNQPGGCTGEASFTIAEEDTPMPVITGDTEICPGETTQLSVDGSFNSYEWSNGSMVPSISVGNPGMVSVTVTNAVGCEGVATVDIQQNNLQPPSVNPVQVCQGESATLSAAACSGGTIRWYSSPTGGGLIASGPVINTPELNNTTTYYVECSIGDCVSDRTPVTVTVTPLVTPSLTPIGPLCVGGPPVPLLNQQDGVFGTWSGPSGDISVFAPVSAGIYPLEFTPNPGGCFLPATTDVQVLQNPIPQIDGTEAICTGGSGYLSVFGGNFASFMWNIGVNLSTIPISAPGTYTVTVTSQSGGCTGEASVTVVEDEAPVPEITGNLEICPGEATLLSVGSGFDSYEWSDGSTGASISVDIPGTVGVTVTNDAGCEGSASVEIQQSILPSPEISGPDSLCPDVPGTLSVTDSDVYDSFSWSTNESTASISIPGPGSYSITVSNSEGCEAVETFVVAEDTAVPPSITGDEAFCEGGSTLLTITPDTYSDYSWSTGGDEPSEEITTEGTVSVTVTDTNGCIAETGTTITENPLPLVQLDGDPSFCVGEMATISVVDSASYSDISWSNNESGGSISVSSPGSYSVTATDLNGCVDTASTLLTEEPLPDAAINGLTTFCTGGSVTLTAAPEGMTYEWSNGATTPATNIGTPGEVFLTVTNAAGCQSVASVQLSEVTELEPSISGPGEFCEGETIVLSGTPGFADYAWSDNTSSPNLEVSQGGIYTLTVTDLNGCTGTTSVTVTQNTLPQASISGDLSFCEGGATTLEAPSGLESYAWSDNSSGQVLSVGAPGMYGLTVTDANGCQDSTSAEVIQQPLPVAEIEGELSFCADTFSLLGLSQSFEDIEWSDGSTGPALQVSAPGDVSVTVTDANGCQDTAFAAVEVLPLPAFEFTGPQAFCAGSSVTLGTDGSFNTYDWSTGGTGATEEVTAPGIVSLAVTDANGCSISNTILIEENALPNAEISGALAFCEGEGTVLSGPDGLSGYSWSGGTADQELSVAAPGTYSLTVTNDEGCQDSISVSVIQNPLPDPELTGDFTFCADTTGTLNLSQTYETYTWYDGSSGPSITVMDSGPVAVTVTDSNGCENNTSDTITVNPLPTFEFTGSQVFCADETVVLGTDGDFETYNWSTGATADTITVSASGEISLTVADTNGCSTTNAVTLTAEALPVAEISGSLAFCSGDSTTLSGPAGLMAYEWSNGATTAAISVNEPGVYELTVTNAAGCTDATTVTVEENALPEPEIQGIAAFCPDSTVALSLDQPYESYAWSTGAVSSAIDVSTAGIITVTVTNEAGCTGRDTLQTEIFPAPQVAILGDNAFCSGDSVLLSADSAFPVFSWSTGATGESIDVNSPGDYSLTITDINGCPASASTTVVENALPVPDINGPDFFCAGDSVTLQATSGFESYLWSDGSGMDELVVSTQGVSAVTVTDANGCQGNTSYFVDEISLPAPQINGVPAFCPGESTVLSASSIFNSYSWSTGDTTGTTEVATVGNVILTVTNDQGCVGTDTIGTSEYETAIPQIDGEPNFCPGTSTVLNAETGFETYQWSNNTGTSEVEVTEPGTIEVTVTDVNGCETSNSIEVGLYTVLPPVIQGPEGFCTDTLATLSAGAGYTAYAWSTGSDLENITIDSGGVYRVTVTDANGCISQDNYQLLEYNLPSVAIGGSASFCPGGFATLNAGADYAAYAWSTGSGASSIEVDQEGLYSLTVTDDNGCTNNASLQVTQQEELSPVISGPLQFCPGTQTQLSAGSAYTVYEWQGGAETAGITVTEPGTYSVYVEDASGCSGTASVEVSLFTDPEVSIAAPEGFCVDESATLTANGANLASFEWEDGSFDPVRTVTTPGTYTVVATDINGCLDTADYEIITFPLPDFEIEGTPYFCAGSSTVLQASEPFAVYEWNGSAGDSTFEAGTAGLFVLEVADSNGCRNQASLQVDAIPLPVADPGMPDTLTCTVEAVTIGGNGTSTGPAFAYEWTGPGITAQNAVVPAPTVVAAGSYELIVTDTIHGCVSEPGLAEVPLSNDVPVISLAVNDTLDCATTALTIDGSASSSWPALTYQWEDLSGTLLATNTDQLTTENPGFYVLILEDAETGCAERDTVQVIQDIEVPTAEAGPTQRLDCAITSVQLSAGGSTQGGDIAYTWLDGGGAALATTDSVLVSAPGTYTLQVLNTRNSCNSEDEVVITQDIATPVADAGPPQQIDCINPIAILNGTGSQTGPDISHQWAFGEESNLINGGLTLSVDTAGTYFLIVTDEDNQCQSVATVEVSEIAAAPTALLTTANGPTCFGEGNGSILISGVEGGTSPYLYSFNGAAFDQQATFSNLDGGVYNLVVQDAIGCEYETEIVLEEGNDLDVEIIEQDQNGQIQVELGEVATLTAAVNVEDEEIARYVWRGSDSLSCYDCPVTFVIPSASGSYQVEVTDLNGCTATDQIQLILNKDRRVYVPNVFSPNGDGANDIFFVQAGPEVINIEAFEIYNRWGEPVFNVFGAPPNDPVFGWDGHYRGELMNGAVFTWFARVEYVDGVVELFKGDVVLMR